MNTFYYETINTPHSQESSIGGYLFPVRLDKGEDKASVHDGEQIIEEKSKTCIQSLNQLQILMTKSPSCYILHGMKLTETVEYVINEVNEVLAKQ